MKSSKVNLINNGYEGIVIAINPSVPEDEKLIQNIKEMVNEASTYLFHATKRRVYFRNVSILIPMTWKSKSEYLMPKQESYDQADVIVANPYLKYGDDPYTLQYGRCGEKGQYIHFTPNFLLTNNLPIYGSRGRVFVHEWAHLRWGIFDENNGDQPFYISRRNTIEATRCSTHITGTNVVFKKCQGGSCITRPCRRDSQTGLYEAECTFIPEKSQTAKESIMFMQSLHSVTEFCTEKTHNTEAPNLQNKMCNGKSTWDVIMNSADFQNTSSMTEMNPPTRPTFSLLRSKQRVVCLVLDKSGSMSSEDRLFRMNQAAELFLIQIIEKGSLVGMVTFDSVAEIRNHLTKITDDDVYKNITANLPQEADGGTSICRGLKAGFQAIIQSNQSTSGSEIILLTDGEDNEIHLCIEEVKQSGVIIHTIALGPSAAKELETLSDITGGHRFYANKDINGLTNAFSRISSRSGSITQQTVQLESKALAITGKKWVNGTVPVDSTIGNDTFFVVTWTIKKPEVLLQDPKGKKYKTSDFKEDKLNIGSARLRIPGIAETGTWTYSLLNNHASSQMLTVTVTTRARSPTTPPVTATAHMSQYTAHYPSPVIVYAQVSQGFLPVLGISVIAFIETEDGHQVTLELWDNGAGPAPRPALASSVGDPALRGPDAALSCKPTAKPADVSGISPGGTGPGSRPLPPGLAAGFEAVVLSPRPTLSLPLHGNDSCGGGAGAASLHLPRLPPPLSPGAPARPRRLHLPARSAGCSARLTPRMNIMDFNVKKLAADAGTFLSRAVQFTEEKLGQAEKTELDAHLENLLSKAECTKIWTEKIMKQTEVLLQPNPNARIEEFVYEKLDRKAPSRINNPELLGQYMIDAGTEFGPGTAYGNALIKCGETQKRIGTADRELIQTSALNFLTPLRNFIEGDYKTIAKERKLLQNKRLDLDAAKTRLKKAKAAETRASSEQELRITQSEFDRQAEITRLLLEGISSTHAHHLRCLNDFVEAQMTYYAQCYQYMLDLQKQLGSFPSSYHSNNNQTSVAPVPSASSNVIGSSALTSTSSLVITSPSNLTDLKECSGSRRARVLYDYDAANSTELSLLADEVITVFSVVGMDSDWLMGERGNQKGRVPITYLELLN
ncbi:hypothetical protein AB1E18_002149 [Capra hircus]